MAAVTEENAQSEQAGCGMQKLALGVIQSGTRAAGARRGRRYARGVKSTKTASYFTTKAKPYN